MKRNVMLLLSLLLVASVLLTACQPADLAVYFDLPTQMANVAMNARGPVAALRIAQFLDTFK